jgi:hypothetical protein
MPVIATHVPGDACESHASHSPAHAALQQAPSTQKSLEHSLARAHAAPFASFGAHAVVAVLQYASAAQSVSCAQVVVQAAFAQRNGSHAVMRSPLPHVPAPSHVGARTSSPMQTFGPHDAPATVSTLPVHESRVMPSHCAVAQTLAPAAHGARVPCGAPTTAMHVPGDIATSHASHSFVHADEQQ